MVLRHAWPDGDLSENTRASQRVKGLKEEETRAAFTLLEALGVQRGKNAVILQN